MVKERGKIIVKGKGELLTYWMEYKPNRLPPPKNKVSISHEICLFKFDIMYITLSFTLSGFGHLRKNEVHPKINEDFQCLDKM